MTSLTRPVAGDPLSSSNGKASTVIIDEAFDLVEANEAALARRTSSSMVTADSYADGTATILDTAEATTDWKGLVSGPFPAVVTLDATYFSEGTHSIKAVLNQHTDPAAGFCYIVLNLSSPLIYTGTILLDVATTAVSTPPVNNMTQVSFVMSDQTQTGGVWRGTTYTKTLSAADAAVFTGLGSAPGTFHTIALDGSALSTISSIGIILNTSGSGAFSLYLDQPRLAPQTGLDQAYGSSTEATAVVPATYSTALTQYPLHSDPDKGLLDLRMSNAVHAGLGGVRNIREWASLDVTGTTDMTGAFQDILDSLDPGTTLELNATDVLKIDKPFFMRNPNVTLDMRGAAIVTGLRRGDVWCTVQSPNVTMRRGRMYGFKGTGDGDGGTTQNGSLLVTVAGTPTNSGTTKVLDALNEAVDLPQNTAYTRYYYFSRDEQNRNRFDFTLSDTTHVASDCTITATTPDGAVIKTQSYTLTGTPTSYTFYVENPPVTERLDITVKKATSTANAITITNYTPFNYCLRSLGTAPDGGTYSNNTFIDVTGDGSEGAHNFLLEDFLVEGSQGNGVRINYGPILKPYVRGAILRRVTARACGQHGFTFNNGTDIEMTDCDAIGCERWGIDIEPETQEAIVSSVSVQNFRVINAGLGPWDLEGWIRVFDVQADGLYFYSDHQTYSWFTGLGTNSRYSNILCVRTDVPTNAGVSDFASFLGTNCIVDGMHLDGCIQVPDSTRADAAAVSRRTEYLTLNNVYLPKPGTIAALWVQAPRCIVDGLRIGSSYEAALTTANSIMPFMVQNDTVVRNVDFGRFTTSFPNTFKGTGMTSPWFMNGLDMRAEGVSNARGLSGSTTKSNNLRGIATAATAGATTQTVVFPTKTQGTLTAVSKFAGATGGTLTASTSYFYKVAPRSIQSGPTLPSVAQLSTTTAVGETGITLGITGTIDLTNGIYVEGLTIYRGVTTNVYNSRFDIYPNSPMAGWGDPGGSANQVFLTDLGTTIVALTGQRYYGYTFPVSVQSGAVTPVDESGWEPDTNYDIWFTCDWPGSPYITARRRDGFDVAFTVPPPTGGSRFSYLVVR